MGVAWVVAWLEVVGGSFELVEGIGWWGRLNGD